MKGRKVFQVLLQVHIDLQMLAFKTGVPLGRITKGMGDIGGLLAPIHAISESSRISQMKKKKAELLRTGKTSGDMFSTIETSSRGDWDQWGGMYKPDKKCR